MKDYKNDKVLDHKQTNNSTTENALSNHRPIPNTSKQLQGVGALPTANS